MDQDQDRFLDTIARAVARDGAPLVRRSLFGGGAAALLAALGLGAAGVEDAAAGECRRHCRDKKTRRARRRCLRRCQNQREDPLGCSPPNNTQGSCPDGQICNSHSICVTP